MRLLTRKPIDDRRSFPGFIILLWDCTTCLCSRMQRYAICEPRNVRSRVFLDMSYCLHDILFIRGHLGFMRSCSAEQKVVSSEDNEGTVRLANNSLKFLNVPSTLMCEIIFFGMR